MNSQELLVHLNNRIEQLRPFFHAKNPDIDTDGKVYAGLGNKSMDLFVEKGGIAKGKVREFTMSKILEIDPTIPTSISLDEKTRKEYEATCKLGEESVGADFVDLLFEKLQAYWLWESQTFNYPQYLG